MEILPIGTILIGKSAAEILETHSNIHVCEGGVEYEVIGHVTRFGSVDLVIENVDGTFTMEPDMNGHSFATFFRVKGE